MKNTCTTLLCTALLLMCASAGPATKNADGLNFSMAAATAKPTGDEPTTVILSIENASDRPIHLFGQGVPAVRFAMTRDGAPVPLTGYGHDASDVRKMQDIQLPPHRALRYAVVMSRRFDMSVEGEYALSCELSYSLGEPRKDGSHFRWMWYPSATAVKLSVGDAPPMRLLPARPSTREAR